MGTSVDGVTGAPISRVVSGKPWNKALLVPTDMSLGMRNGVFSPPTLTASMSMTCVSACEGSGTVRGGAVEVTAPEGLRVQ